jgi:hypothetical protein
MRTSTNSATKAYFTFGPLSEPSRQALVALALTKESGVDTIDNEPALVPSADTQAEKQERVRAGKRVASVFGIIALMFMVACFGIIGYWFFAAAA